MLSLILLPLYFFLFIGLFLRLTLYTCLLISYLLSPSPFFFFFLQSKHKKDAFAIRPILLNKLEVEICLSLFPFARVLVAMCHHVPHFFLSFFFLCVCVYIYIYVHHHLSCVLFFCPPLSFIFCVP